MCLNAACFSWESVQEITVISSNLLEKEVFSHSCLAFFSCLHQRVLHWLRTTHASTCPPAILCLLVYSSALHSRVLPPFWSPVCPSPMIMLFPQVLGWPGEPTSLAGNATGLPVCASQHSLLTLESLLGGWTPMTFCYSPIHAHTPFFLNFFFTPFFIGFKSLGSTESQPNAE